MTDSAIVVGAGIGGLTAAAALCRAGVAVTLCERAPQLRAAGFGLAVQSNAMNALRTLDLGVDAALLEAGSQVTTFSFRTAAGTLLRRVDLSPLDTTLGAPSVVLARKDLHDVLLDSAGSGLQVLTGAEAVGFEQDSGGVTLRLADGRRLDADVLIGADGINSAVRSQFHGVQQPRPANFVCWLALARCTPAMLAPGESIHFWGADMRFGLHDCGHGTVYWWATMSTDAALAAHWPHGKADLLRRLAQWHPGITEIVSATEESAILTVPAVDREPLRHWGEGRVTLLGDAAHPMLPSLGQGANSAIEDAVVLAHMLSVHPDPRQALRSYEQHRIPRTTELVDGSRRLARIEENTNPVVLGIRRRLIRHAGERTVHGFMAKPMTWPGFGDTADKTALPRRLSALERWHWTADRVSPLNICARVRIEGRVAAAEVEAALNVLAHRHPMLRAAIHGRSFRPTAQHTIPLRTVDGGCWRTEVDRELQAAFDGCGPLLRATLVSTGPGVHDVLLTSTYAIADGVAMITLCRQLVELLAGADSTRWHPEIPASPAPEVLLPKQFQGLRGKLRALGRMAADAAGQRGGAPMLRLAPSEAVPAARRRSRLAHRTIAGGGFQHLMRQCRSGGLLPESAIATALAIAAIHETDCRRGCLAVSVSVPFRKHLTPEPAADATGSFQAMVAIPICCESGGSLWEAAPPADARLRTAIERRHHLANLPLLGALATITPTFTDRVVGALDAGGPGNLCMSLVDAADFPARIGGLRLSGIQVVSGMSISGYLILYATIGRDELSLNLGYVDGIITAERAEALMDGVVDALSADDVVGQRLAL
ncbi:hypothetical protein B1R94_18225 [Mycolicibacterium litorale]|nr:hypothetical protein B1R94_18225 [Mycolicibacterium litorale]